MIIIGIAGGTGCGKTTVVKKIAETLPPDNVAVIPLDSYYNQTDDLTPEQRRQINFDHPNAFDWDLLFEHISMLKNGQAVEQPIVEGIRSLIKKELWDLMDLKIFVDTDSDERLIRIIKRDVLERGRTAEMVMERYVNILKPMHLEFIEPTKRYADIIIPQGGDNEKGISIIKKYILSIQ